MYNLMKSTKISSLDAQSIKPILILIDDDFLLSHHYLKSIGALQQLTQIFRNNLPPQTPAILTPSSVRYFTFLGEIIPIQINLILTCAFNHEGRRIIE